MSLVTTSQQVWAFLSKPRGRSARNALTRIQRRARDVMSMASVFMFFGGGWWLFIALAAWEASSLPGNTTHPASAQKVLDHWQLMPSHPFNPWTLVAAWLLGFIATMAPLVCLRRLGKTLQSETPLSVAVARRFLWLGHALSANLLLGFGASVIAASAITNYQFSTGSGFWATLTAALLAYLVADLVREGARAAEENREFV